jgi:hypothetical protein
MLAKIAGDAQLAGVGIVDPFAEHRSRPLLEHLEDFRRYLAAKGNTGEYCQKIASRARVVLESLPTKDAAATAPALQNRKRSQNKELATCCTGKLESTSNGPA